MNKRSTHTVLLFTMSFLMLNAKDLPSKEVIVNTIKTVNDYWQNTNSNHNRAFWDNAAYHTGNMAAYELTKINRYKTYSTEWAAYNQWMGAKSEQKEDWRYSYGESDRYVLFGDWQICFQTYIDLFNYSKPKDSTMIVRALDVMAYQTRTKNTDYWWWADGLYMVMPVMTKLYKITGDELYLTKLYDYFSYSKSIMYDDETGLFYRDAHYVYPDHSTNSGKKDFWARGDGWVFAGLAKIIEDLPMDYTHRGFFIDIYSKMAASLKAAQQEEGYWTRSLLDPAYAPGYETSGSAFFTFGMAWGINYGLLPKEEYLSVVEKGWSYLQDIALQDKGSVGYVQPIGASASPDTWVDENSTANFGTGAFLLAGSEVVHLASGEMPEPSLLYMDSIKLLSKNELIIYFNDSLESESASNINAYLIDSITVDAAHLLPDKKSVQIDFKALSIGTHTLSISNIKNKQNQACEDGEKQSFTYLGNYSVTAIGYESGTQNTPEKTLDGNYDTRWSCEGDSVWIAYDLGRETLLESIEIAFYNGHRRQNYFALESSSDGTTFHRIYKGHSSGDTWELETYTIEKQKTRYVRIMCFGNSSNLWNSITEVKLNTTTIATISNTRQHDVTIYPNPNHGDKLSFEGDFPDSKYQLYGMNSQGHIDFTCSVSPVNNTFSLQPPEHLNGYYTIILQSKNKTSYHKILLD